VRKTSRSMIVASIDGVPAPESALAEAFVREGFARRQGALVRLAGEHARPFAERRTTAKPAEAAEDELDEELDDELDEELDDAEGFDA